MSPIGSYVGGLTSKGQVGVLLWEHRGWILRMAALIKGRLSDNRPEAFAASFQTKRTLNICLLSFTQTTWNQLSTDVRRSPFLSRKELRFASFPFLSFWIFLPLYTRTFRFVPAISLDCTVSRIQPGFLLSKDKVLSLLATSLLNRNPYGFPINGSPVF